jgi:hypothetical protein
VTRASSSPRAAPLRLRHSGRSSPKCSAITARSRLGGSPWAKGGGARGRAAARAPCAITGHALDARGLARGVGAARA